MTAVIPQVWDDRPVRPDLSSHLKQRYEIGIELYWHGRGSECSSHGYSAKNILVSGSDMLRSSWASLEAPVLVFQAQL